MHPKAPIDLNHLRHVLGCLITEAEQRHLAKNPKVRKSHLHLENIRVDVSIHTLRLVVEALKKSP